MDQQRSQSEKAVQLVDEALKLSKNRKDNETVFAILEMDCSAGYITEWTPQLYNRLYRHDKDRAIRLFSEISARHPDPTQFKFSADSLKLTVGGEPIENLFATIAAERTGQLENNPEVFIGAWESFVNASRP